MGQMEGPIPASSHPEDRLSPTTCAPPPQRRSKWGLGEQSAPSRKGAVHQLLFRLAGAWGPEKQPGMVLPLF